MLWQTLEGTKPTSEGGGSSFVGSEGFQHPTDYFILNGP